MVQVGPSHKSLLPSYILPKAANQRWTLLLTLVPSCRRTLHPCSPIRVYRCLLLLQGAAQDLLQSRAWEVKSCHTACLTEEGELVFLYS